VKAIDIWMVGCIFFVFITLLEFSVLTWRRHLGAGKISVVDGSEPSEINIGNKVGMCANVENKGLKLQFVKK